MRGRTIVISARLLIAAHVARLIITVRFWRHTLREWTRFNYAIITYRRKPAVRTSLKYSQDGPKIILVDFPTTADENQTRRDLTSAGLAAESPVTHGSENYVLPYNYILSEALQTSWLRNSHKLSVTIRIAKLNQHYCTIFTCWVLIIIYRPSSEWNTNTKRWAV